MQRTWSFVRFFLQPANNGHYTHGMMQADFRAPRERSGYVMVENRQNNDVAELDEAKLGKVSGGCDSDYTHPDGSPTLEEYQSLPSA